MHTGDKVLALLGAKVVCCGLLALAAAGMLGGGLAAWLFEGPGRWLLAAGLAVAIAAIVLGRRESAGLRPPVQAAKRHEQPNL